MSQEQQETTVEQAMRLLTEEADPEGSSPESAAADQQGEQQTAETVADPEETGKGGDRMVPVSAVAEEREKNRQLKALLDELGDEWTSFAKEAKRQGWTPGRVVEHLNRAIAQQSPETAQPDEDDEVDPQVQKALTEAQQARAEISRLRFEQDLAETLRLYPDITEKALLRAAKGEDYARRLQEVGKELHEERAEMEAKHQAAIEEARRKAVEEYLQNKGKAADAGAERPGGGGAGANAEQAELVSNEEKRLSYVEQMLRNGG